MDEEILSILGIDSVEDLTQEEYLSLLKEASVRAQMKGSAISSGALIAITQEIKRVRRESTTATAKGTSQEEVRKRKVNPQKVFASKPKPVQRPVGQKLLTASKEKEAEDQKETRALTRVIPSALNTLAAGVNNIVQVMVKDLTMEKKQSEAERKAAENLGREEREEDSEKKVADKSKNFFKGFKPPQLGIFDKLKNFFTMVALGGLFTWLSKPENQDKVTKFTDFIKDHGGKILMGIAGLLALGIGAQILGFIGTLITAGGALLALFTNPVFLAVMAAFGLRTALYSRPVQEFISKPFIEGLRRDLIGEYGEERAGLGQFTKAMRTQYGRVAKKEDFDKMTDEEKSTAHFLKIFDDELRSRAKLDKKLARLKQQQEEFEKKNGKPNAKLTKEIAELEEKVKDSDIKITNMRAQFDFGGQSFDEAFAKFRAGGEATLPQTSLSQRLYPEQTLKPNMGSSSYMFGEGWTPTGELPANYGQETPKSELTERELLKKYWDEGVDKMTDEEKKTLWESLGPKIMSKMGDLKPDYEKFLKDNKMEDSYESWLAYQEKENIRFTEKENRYYKHKPTPTPKPKPKPAGPDAPVLPEGADAANKAHLDKIRQGGADPKTKAILEELFKTSSLVKPVQVSVTPAVIPPGPGQGASAHAGQNSAPRFPTTDQSNMSVAAVAGVYNSPIPRA